MPLEPSTPHEPPETVRWGLVSGEPPIANHVWVHFKLQYEIQEYMPKRVRARQRWTLSNVAVSGVRLPGWRWASQPVLFNPDVDVDEAGNEIANTQNLVVTNVQFALSPSRLGDETTLDNPQVTALFAASSDANRPGPLTVAPGQELALTPSGLGDPVSGGRTLLVKGEVLDDEGVSSPFMMEWIAVPSAAPPVSTPASSSWSLVLCGALALGTIAYLGKRYAAAVKS